MAVLIKNTDETFTAGPLDVLCLLHDTTTGRWHPAFFEEAPFPGPVPDVQDVKMVRLKSSMHHTDGAETEKEGMGLLHKLSLQIKVPPENIWVDSIEWDGQHPMIWIGPNWRKPT